jgi:hypothetical protein
MKYAAIAGGVLVAIVATIFAVGHFSTSPQKWIAKRYTTVGYHRYHSAKPPSRVAAEITRKFRPVDRIADSAGTYLQYRSWVVGVLPGGGGTDITVDSPSAGYNRYSSHVGRYWHRPGSNGWDRRGGASFRGGGSGSGK